jgi:hypothetical protein
MGSFTGDYVSSINGLTGAITGVVRFTSSLTAPTGVSVGHKWFDEASGTEFTYIYDGDTYQWVDIAGGNGSSQSSDTNAFNNKDVLFLDYMIGTNRRYYLDTIPSGGGTWFSGNVSATGLFSGRMGMNRRSTSNLGTAVKFYRSISITGLVYLGGPNEITECGFGVLNELTGSTNDNPSRLIAGIIDSFTTGPALPNHGAYFMYEQNLNDGRLACVVKKSGVPTPTTVDSGITYATNTWYDLKIVASGSDIIRFYINDDLVAGITSNIPTDSAMNTVFEFGRGGVTGTTGTIGIVHNYMYTRKVFP